MSPIAASGLVRVTVASHRRRVDLVLPGAIPLAELVPELARSVGLLDAVTVHGGYRLLTQDGRCLVTDAGLVVQGVRDGSILFVAAGVEDEPPRRYDDVVEAMYHVVQRDIAPWDAAAGRRTALSAGVVLLGVGAASLLLGRGAHLAAVAGAVAVVLVLGAVAVSRTRGETDAVVAAALTGCGYAGLAGVLVVPGTPFSGGPVAAAGGGTLVAGLVAGLGLARGRTLLLPPVVCGALLLAAGLLINASMVDPAVVLTAVLAVTVIAGSAFPWLALGATGTRVDRLVSTTDITRGPDRIDLDRVADDARVGHQVLVALSATVGVLLVLVSPAAVSLGVAGTATAVLAGVVLVLRTRQYLAGTEVLAGLIFGALGLLSTAVSVLWLHPGWRAGTSVVLVTAGVVLLALALRPHGPSAGRGWLGDLAETVALFALLPALVTATGVLSSIGG